MRARLNHPICRAAALALLHGLCASAFAQPLSTAFTYQGELRTAGLPATGLHDLRFRLYDSQSGGTQLGTMLCADNVTLTQGRFTVLLDFFSQYAGQKRFLEIEVRADTGLNCTSGVGFTLLTPRQELTATPNASFALNAAVAALANTASTATTATNATQLNGQGASFYQNAANLTSGSIPGARLNGAYPGIVQMENLGNTFAGTGTGLVGLNASNLSSGTLDPARLPVPLLKTGSLGPNLYIIAADNSSSESNAMGLYGGASAAAGFTFGVQGRSASTEGVGVLGWAVAPTGATRGVFGQSSSDNGTGVLGWAPSATGTTFGVWGTSDSSDGRGVFGSAGAATGTTTGVFGTSSSTSGRGVYGESTATTGGTYGGRFEHHSTDGAAVYGLAASPTGNAFGAIFESMSPFGNGVYAAGGQNGGWFRSTGTGGNGVFGEYTGTVGTGTGVYGQTSAAGGMGVRGVAGLPTTEVNYGGHFMTFSSAGRGVYGLALAGTGTTYGVYGQTSSSSGRGVQGEATATSGSTIGVRGIAPSDAGIGVSGEAGNSLVPGVAIGVKGMSASPNGTGVYGEANSLDNGANYGVTGRSWNSNGVGVYGHAAGGGPNTLGVFGVSVSTSGAGVRGWATASTGVSYGVIGQSDSTAGIGGQFRGRGADAVFIENFGTGRGVHVVAPSDTPIWAETTNGVAGVDSRTSNTSGSGVFGINFGTTGNSFGVVGQTASGTNGFGVYAFGRSGASGTKAFRIDHPDDPENKYLLHYSAESPEVINFYRGTITLDGAGMADVELPAYFAKINTSPSYQLTAVGAAMPLLHVAVEIDERSLSDGAKAGPAEAAPICRFRIAGGAPGKKVSWEVKAVRNDQWVQQHGAPVEVEKPDAEKGTYQHPDLYNQPADKGTNSHVARPAAQPIAAAPAR